MEQQDQKHRPSQEQQEEPGSPHSFGPELGQGTSQDILTGRPTEQVAQEQDAQFRETLNAKVQQGMRFENELHGKPGSQIIDKVEGCFEARLQEIANADPECLAYRKILRSLQHEVTVGRYVKKEVAKLKQREEAAT